MNQLIEKRLTVESEFIQLLRKLLIRDGLSPIGTLIADELCGLSEYLQSEGEIVASMNYYQAGKTIEETFEKLSNKYNI